jgi:hypothetical protein
MLTTILAFLSNSWVGQIISTALSWYTTWQANQAAAASAEQQAESSNANDGAQSVLDQESDDAQNAALDNVENQIDNPTPIVVKPGGPSAGTSP